jgi:hypothetical protein
VRAENRRIAVAYNEDGFSSVDDWISPNRNGFIVSIEKDGSCGAQFNRNDNRFGVWDLSLCGPAFGGGHDMCISSDCHESEGSYSFLGISYGEHTEGERLILFGQRRFRVSDYEVFKIEIE